MDKAIIVSEFNMHATNWYRGMGAFHYLLDCRQANRDDLYWGDFFDTKWLILVRTFSDRDIKNAEVAKSMGTKIWFDIDDNYIDVPIYSQINHPALPSFQHRISELFILADIISVSTEFLGNRYIMWMKGKGIDISSKTFIIPNAFNDYRMKLPLTCNDTNNLCIRGNESIRSDILPYIDSMINFMESHEDAHLDFIGTPNDLMAPFKNSTLYEWLVPPLCWYATKKLKPALGLKPLIIDDFNKSKSNCSWIEFTFSGAITITTELDEFNKPGIKRIVDAPDLLHVLDDLYSDKIKREILFQESRDYIINNLCLSDINKMREVLL